jgi:hypothetical protein
MPKEEHGTEYDAEWDELKKWAGGELQKLNEKYHKDIRHGRSEPSDKEKKDKRAFDKEFMQRLEALNTKYGKRPREW